MKKNYITPSMLIVNIDSEAVMVCASCNITMNQNDAYFYGDEVSTKNGGSVDASSYRSNLWDE